MKKSANAAHATLTDCDPPVNTTARKKNRAPRSELPPEGADVLTIKQVAMKLQLCERSVQRLNDEGRIPGRIPFGRVTRFSRLAIEEWILNGCPEGPRRKPRAS